MTGRDTWKPPGGKALYMTVVVVVAFLFLILEINFWQGSALHDFNAFVQIPAEILAKWNSVHGSLNEAGNYLIEVSKEQVGSNIAKELKKLNRRWAKFIKRTHFVSYWFHMTLLPCSLQSHIFQTYQLANQRLINLSVSSVLPVLKQEEQSIHRGIPFLSLCDSVKCSL